LFLINWAFTALARLAHLVVGARKTRIGFLTNFLASSVVLCSSILDHLGFADADFLFLFAAWLSATVQTLT
jgi:hypothetical protein